MIKIASWNIGKDEANADGVVDLDSYEYIKRMIVDNKIDVICFQESITSSDNIIPISKYINDSTELKCSCDFELSLSHINIGCMMGVSICSKFPITSYEKVMFENPNIEFKKDENTTYTSHDKGFLVANIAEMPLVVASGHCLPFHIFERSPTEYPEIFKSMEEKFTDVLRNSQNVIIAGDMNYHDVEELFPNIVGLTSKTVFGSTHKNIQTDDILVSNNIKRVDKKTIETRFDHDLCVVIVSI